MTRNATNTDQHLASHRGGFRISGKGVHMYKGGDRFTEFVSIFLNIL